MKILMIDNYDSFTFNLYQYFGILGADVEVVRNDVLTLEEILKKKFDKVVISPGPGTPDEAGISVELVKVLKGKVPILGVCLGHQAIGKAFGGKIVNAKRIMHGKTSLVSHFNSSILFKNIQNPFVATRYHSLVIEKETLPDCLKITAISNDGEIMAVEHRSFRIYGIQFHPESILTVEGMKILKNFLIHG